MKFPLRLVIVLAAVGALVTGALAGPNVAGAWKGKIVIDDSKMTLKDPAQIKMAKQQIAQARTIKVTLTLNANKTFVGGPPPSTGKWSQSGNSVILTSDKKGPDGKNGTQTFTLSKDGKTLTLAMPARQGILSKIVLTR
jgi:hypothetical protein